MAYTFKARIIQAIVKFLEPQIQCIITDRILKYNEHLVKHGAIKRVVHQGPLGDCNVPSNPQPFSGVIPESR